MTLGLLSVRLLVRESRSLKDKRQVVRSILERLRGQFNVGASETDTQDDHRLATLGFVAVGPEMEVVRGVLQLPPDVAGRVAYKNAAALFHLE